MDDWLPLERWEVRNGRLDKWMKNCKNVNWMAVSVMDAMKSLLDDIRLVSKCLDISKMTEHNE